MHEWMNVWNEMKWNKMNDLNEMNKMNATSEMKSWMKIIWIEIKNEWTDEWMIEWMNE